MRHTAGMYHLAGPLHLLFIHNIFCYWERYEKKEVLRSYSLLPPPYQPYIIHVHKVIPLCPLPNGPLLIRVMNDRTIAKETGGMMEEKRGDERVRAQYKAEMQWDCFL